MSKPQNSLGLSWWRTTTVYVLKHPSLWRVAIRQARRFVPQGWWKTRPFLPLPPADFVAFRIQTFAGNEPGGHPTVVEVDRYLRWCNRLEQMRRDRLRQTVHSTMT